MNEYSQYSPAVDYRSPWRDYFAQGGSYVMAAEPFRAKKRLRNNTLTLCVLAAILALSVALTVWLIIEDGGRGATYVLLGLFVAILIGLMIMVRSYRRALKAVVAADSTGEYLRIDAQGITVNGQATYFWSDVFGGAAVDERHVPVSGWHRFANSVLPRAGMSRAALVLGFRGDARVKRDNAPAGAKALITQTFGQGGIRIPLDLAFSDETDQVYSAMVAASCAAELHGIDVLIFRSEEGQPLLNKRDASFAVMTSLMGEKRWHDQAERIAQIKSTL